jgi:hypothetical protein
MWCLTSSSSSLNSPPFFAIGTESFSLLLRGERERERERDCVGFYGFRVLEERIQAGFDCFTAATVIQNGLVCYGPFSTGFKTASFDSWINDVIHDLFGSCDPRAL